MRTSQLKTLMLASLMLWPILGTAQVKIGYIESERIRNEYEDFKDAESQLQLEFQKVQTEYQGMLAHLDSIKQTYDTQRLMSSPDWRRQKEDEISNLEQQIQFYQNSKVGPDGELYKKQAQMEYDILAKVKAAVDKVAIKDGYDFIFDGSVSLLYGKPTYDVTDDVLHELKNVTDTDTTNP